jgi:hypothetical protein
MVKLIKILQQGQPTFPCILEEATVKFDENLKKKLNHKLILIC